jgi:hypothetical protein
MTLEKGKVATTTGSVGKEGILSVDYGLSFFNTSI